MKKYLSTIIKTGIWHFITARRHTSEAYAVVVCPSVCLFVPHKPVLRNNWTIALLLARRLPSAYPTLSPCKKIWVSPKIRVLPSLGLCPKLRT